MAGPAIVFEGVWKKFRRGERHDSIRDLIPAMLGRMLAPKAKTELSEQEFWALQDVSFAVERGEALGIIGPNGAGKSTTLKLLTKILRPTRGRCFVKGRVGALIEVAAGFHPDLTGRENVYLQGAIMGMSRNDILRRLDEIIDFAGVESFIDTPVKRYSSGMNARLGFSIAAHLDPDALIIDEVLSVGDAAFQERCVRRMEQFKRNGAAIAFVSHNLQAITSLCDKAILLKGRTLYAGTAEETVREYVLSAGPGPAGEASPDVTLASEPLVDDVTGRRVESATPGQSLRLRVDFTSVLDSDDLTFGFIVYRSTDMLIVYEGNALAKEVGFAADKQAHSVDFRFRANLTRGQYHIECYALHNPTHEYLGRLSPAAIFAVQETVTCRGVADLALSVSATALSHQ